jgi:DNA-binding NtrC family response regulator
MENIHDKLLAEAEKKLQMRSYAEAYAMLKDCNFPMSHKEEYGSYCILLTDSAMHVGDYCLEHIDEAIEIFRFNINSDKFAAAKYVKGCVMLALGEYIKASEIITEAYVNYIRYKSYSNAAKALNKLAYVSLILGNVSAASSYSLKAMEFYNMDGNEKNAELISQGLACIHFKSGKIADAIEIYDGLKDKVKTHGEVNEFIFYFMSPLPYALRGDCKKAREIIAKCKPYLGKYKRETTIYYENLGWIEMLDGKYDKAEKALKAGLEMALEIAPESALFSQIARLLADLYLAKSQYNLARKYAHDALKVSEKINERLEIAACYRIFAQIEQHDGNSEKAREWYKQAIDLFARVEAHYELAVTRYLAAVSGAFENGQRLALLYLAREYFESESIADFIEKTEHEIKSSVFANRRDISEGNGAPVIIGNTPEITKIRELAENVAASGMALLLTGDTGTGKDLLAQYIHYCSGRSGNFVMVNAAAIPNSMVESELFGHVKGSFTSAAKDRAGLFEMADKGTLYLNEIGDASPEFQAKLLDVLETKIVRRLGENKNRKVDFRLIAATNRCLEDLLEKEIFRFDLYYRINEIQIRLPGLGDRVKDIAALTEYFLIANGLRPGDNNNGPEFETLAELLSRRDWPGNVRQIKSEINRLFIMSEGSLARMIELAQRPDSRNNIPEDIRLLKMLESTSWNRRQAARMLGVSEATIRKRIKKYDLIPSSQI